MFNLRYILGICLLIATSACVSVDETRGTPLQIAQVNTDLAKSYYSKGMYDVAEEKLQRALKAQDDYVAANILLSLVYVQQGKREKAAEQFEKTLDLTSHNSVEFAEVSNNYAVFLCEKGKWGEAESHFIDAVNVEGYKTKAAAFENAGFCALTAKDYPKAGLYFSKALEQNKAMARSMLGLSQVNIQAKDWTAAEALLTKFQKVTAATDESLYLLSQVEEKLGNQAQATEYKQQLREKFPGSAFLKKLN